MVDLIEFTEEQVDSVWCKKYNVNCMVYKELPKSVSGLYKCKKKFYRTCTYSCPKIISDSNYRLIWDELNDYYLLVNEYGMKKPIRKRFFDLKSRNE